MACASVKRVPPLLCLVVVGCAAESNALLRPWRVFLSLAGRGSDVTLYRFVGLAVPRGSGQGTGTNEMALLGQDGRIAPRLIAAALAAGSFLIGTQPAAAQTRDADSLLIVDCLLPGKIQRLGTAATYVRARKAIKTTAGECRVRGGEYTEAGEATYGSLSKIWLPLASAGDVEAQTNLGEIFEKGVGGPPQPDLAVKWYQLAADKGFARAQVNLGSLYERGFGVPRNPARAMEWYRRASGLEGTNLPFVTAAQPAKASPAQSSVQAQEVVKLRAERDALSKQLAEERGRRQQLEAELGTVGTRLKGERSSLAQQQAQLADARRELDARTRALEAQRAAQAKAPPQAGSGASAQSPEAAAKLAALQRELDRQRQVVAQRDSQLKAMQGSVAQLEGRSKDLQTKLAAAEQRQAQVAAATPADQQVRTATVQPRRTAPALPPGVNFGRYHALVIGNNDFRFIPKLRTAAVDAQAIAAVLKTRYGFQTTLLLNADRYQLLSALNKLRGQLTSQDNLLVYYAGHGELDRTNNRGYWLPIDAEANSTANWIPSFEVTDILNAMAAKQIMLVADSCYSGMLTRSAITRLDTGMTDTDRARWYQAMATKHVRVVLTSGGVQPVLDGGGGKYSVFASAFLKALQENDQVLEGQKLAQSVTQRVAVSAEASDIDQVPTYAPMSFAGHEAGDFFFVPVR